MNLAFFNLGVSELTLVLLILLLFFGASRLPGLSRALAKSIDEFKKGRNSPRTHEKESGKTSGNDQDS